MKITLFTGKTFDIREALGFDIKIVKSSRARRMTLRIDSKERLPVLTIPERCAAKRAVDFVNLHRGWIERSLARLPQTKTLKTESKSLCSANRLLFAGQTTVAAALFSKTVF